MARPKKKRIINTCKKCQSQFETVPSLTRDFCSKACAQQYKGIDKSWIKTREQTCLSKYGVKNAFQSKEVQDKYKKNLEEKYGVNNPFLVDEFKEKATNTIKEKYNKEYASQNKEIAQKISKSLKGREFNRKKFGVVKWEKLIKYYEVSKMKPLFTKEELINNQLNYYQENKFEFECEKCGERTKVSLSNGYLPSCRCSDYKGYSLIEDELLIFLRKLIPDQQIKLNRRDILPNRLELDFYLPKYNLAIEVNGVYWHSESLGKYRDYHLFKTLKCLEKGINLIHILDYEWLFKRPIIQSIIKNRLGENDDVIYARKCEVKEIEDVKVLRKFLDENHIQGYTHSSTNLGLYYNDKLVSVMTFSKNRFKKKSQELEMVRFCNLLNTNVVGGASKLFKYFNKNFNLKKLPIISFSDRRFFTGGLYQKLGFEFIKNTNPSYVYWKDQKVLSRMSCQKHKLPKLLEKFDPNKSEYENMRNNNWRRIWDSGNSKWKYTY